VATGEILPRAKTKQTARWITDPRSIRGILAEVGEDGGALVQSSAIQNRSLEGDLTCAFRGMLASRLKKLGANRIVRAQQHSAGTSKRPDDFKELARKILIQNGVPRPRERSVESQGPGEGRNDQNFKANFILSLQAKFDAAPSW